MKLRVGILGATGMVGQRFIERLENHPWFKIESLFASEKSRGKTYCEAAKWHLKSQIPASVRDMEVDAMDTERAEDLDLVFSAIPSEIAKEIEGGFAKKVAVFSNTATYRMYEDIPLIIPEVNPDHLKLIEAQREKRNWEGFIVTNPNCTTIGFITPLKPVMDLCGIEEVNLTTMQALSGAGYSGVSSMAILDNVIPFISGEEKKAESEGLKILGNFTKGCINPADFDIFASCNRVMVSDGHTESLFLKTREDFTIEDIKAALSGFRGEPQNLELPSAPENPIVVKSEEDRPQPSLDRETGDGMSICVGRIRKKKEKQLKFTALSHNTIRGAAGASILNAELAHAKKLI